MIETRKILVLSTAHVTKQTADLLNNSDLIDWPCCGGPYGIYGWFVYAHDENLEGGRYAIPDELFEVMVYARSHGCDNVLFDRDADTIDDLPTWEW